MLAPIPILRDNDLDMATNTVKSMRERCAIELQSRNDQAAIEADYLIASVLEIGRAQLYAWPERELTAEHCAQIDGLLSRRISGEPLAYVLGHHEFWSMPLLVSPDVLIPRADTERLVEVALALISKKPAAKILDLGTGSGAIALALASELPSAQIFASDVSETALKIARSNANALSLDVSFIHSNWYQQLPADQFDLIVSNPPYVDAQDPDLEETVRRYEPLSAVVADDEGLADLKTIIAGAAEHLKSDAYLLLEHGWQQDHVVCNLLKQAKFQNVNTWRDLGGHPRVSGGCLPRRATPQN